MKTEATLLFYHCLFILSKEIGPNPQKRSRWNFQKKSPVYCPMLRPRVDVATWISLVCSCSVAILLLLLRPDSLQLLGLMVATSFMVATLLARCSSRVDVATMVSRRDIVVFLFFWLLSHDLSSESGLLFLVALHVMTSVLGCDHISVYKLTSGRDFLFLVAILLVVFCLHRFQF